MADQLIRGQASEVLVLHREGQDTLALNRAKALAVEYMDSALVLNLLGTLHLHGSRAAASPSELKASHRRDAVVAFSDAARLAPNCLMTAVQHAQALAADQRFAEAMIEGTRILRKSEEELDDPRLHNVVYDREHDSDLEHDSDASHRKAHAMFTGDRFIKELASLINNQIMPVEAAKLLGGDGTVDDQVRRLADLFYHNYPYSVRAQLFLVYVELEYARGLDLVADKRKHLRSVLTLISDAANIFDSSSLIALFHANVLFDLDEFDESERVCRRALCIEKPTDPSLDDIPPAVSVPGADYDSRVSAVRKQLCILLRRIIVVAAGCWSIVRYTDHRDMVVRLPVDTLQEHYNGINKPAADAISDAQRFHRYHRAWSFLVGPFSSCHHTKFFGTKSLSEHMRWKHYRYVLWSKLQSVLGADCYANRSLFDGITLYQDSNEHDIFHLTRLQPMFESLLLSPSIGIQAESLAEIRQRKCREGAEVIEDIKEKLSLLPKDEASIEYVDLCFTIQELWLKFLKTSALDYREVILPLAGSFQWMQMKKSIALSVNDLGRFIGGANINISFGKVPAVLDRNVSGVHSSEPSDEALKDTEKCEESEVHVLHTPGTFSHSIIEMASTSSCQQSHNILNKNNADTNMSILSLVIQSFCNLSQFRDNVLTEPLGWISYVDNPSIVQKFCEIFYSWVENDHDVTDNALTCMNAYLCGDIGFNTIDGKCGTNFASEIVATILNGFHSSQPPCSFVHNLYKKNVEDDSIIYKRLCPPHVIFGMEFDMQVSCKCGHSQYTYNALILKLDVGSPRKTKIKSFAELPVLDAQSCVDNWCEDCRSSMDTDLLLLNKPHFFTIVLNWLGGSESQDTLSEVMASITSPLDTGFFCKSAKSSAMYTLTSMVLPCHTEAQSQVEEGSVSNGTPTAIIFSRVQLSAFCNRR